MRGLPALHILWLGLAVACSGTPDKPSDPIQTSCTAGDLDGCHQKASEFDDGSPQGHRRALVAFQYACFLDHQPSCAELARIYGRNPGASQERMVDALESACDADEADACVQLAGRKSRGRAMQLYRKACELGSGQGCHELAELTRRRWMVSASLVKAVELDEKACELGSVDGCVSAGKAHLFGSGVPRDVDRGLDMLEPTCSEESVAGCEVLANLYEQGIGVEADLAKASEYYDRAEQHAEAEPADSPASAFIVFVDACNHGNLLGCFNAAWFRAEGAEVARNITVSRELFQLACRDGLSTACGRWEKIDVSDRPTLVEDSPTAPEAQ